MKYVSFEKAKCKTLLCFIFRHDEKVEMLLIRCLCIASRFDELADIVVDSNQFLIHCHHLTSQALLVAQARHLEDVRLDGAHVFVNRFV